MSFEFISDFFVLLPRGILYIKCTIFIVEFFSRSLYCGDPSSPFCPHLGPALGRSTLFLAELQVRYRATVSDPISKTC